MHYRGAVISSIWRVVGVVLACLYTGGAADYL